MSNNLDLADEAKKAWQEAIKGRGHVNILIVGRTGVGKTTLINTVFQGKLGKTGQGRPVTKNTREIDKEGIPLTIFDTRGLELADFPETIEKLTSLIKDRSRNEDPTRHIHIAWLCITEDSRRVEKADTDLMNSLSDYMPIVVVITKSRSDGGFRQKVQQLLPTARNVVRVRALAEKLDDGHSLQPMGIEELMDLTAELVPDAHRNAFVAAQKASIRLKTKRAQAAVATAATAAAAAGATPIPFSDTALLVPIQVGMLARITAVFGISVDQGFLMGLIGSVATGVGATLIGRTIVTNILKFFPGVGTVAGGVINAATATGLTTAFGEAYIATLVKLTEKSNNNLPTQDEITATFKEEYLKHKEGVQR